MKYNNGQYSFQPESIFLGDLSLKIKKTNIDFPCPRKTILAIIGQSLDDLPI